GVAGGAADIHRAYGEDLEPAKRDYPVLVARLSLAWGSVAKVAPGLAGAVGSRVLKELLALRDRLSPDDAAGDQRKALETLERLGASLPTTPSALSLLPAVQLADAFGPAVEAPGFWEGIAERGGETVLDSAGRAWPTVSVLVSDKTSTELKRHLEKRQGELRAQGRPSAKVESLLAAWNAGRVFVFSRDELAARDALTADGLIDVAKLLGRFDLPVSDDHVIRIITRDPALWWTKGLPASRQELVEFLLLLTKDLYFIATPAHIEEYLAAQKVLAIQA
ncbi:MAG TPA: hypothetical protein P5079_05240, partial [Elusimicrobiota bacterium]|nr:hypothetical protein [Elusimicrobiota bacterium]